MGFKEYFYKSIEYEWAEHYVEYEKLDEILNEISNDKSKKLETEFIENLNNNYYKCQNFFNEKINKILEDNELDNCNSQIISINNLYKFSIINRMALFNICKKHDNVTNISILPYFSMKLDVNKFCSNIEIFKLFSQLSMIMRNTRNKYLKNASVESKYAYLLTKNNKESIKTILDNNDVQTNNFDRYSEKYWIRPEKLTKVMIKIMKNLPMYFFDDNKIITETTSVYLDNDSLSCYHSRIKREEAAKLVRIRWYGKLEDTEMVFIEMKEHHQDWNDIESCKNRFILNKSKVNNFLSGLPFEINKDNVDLELVNKIKDVVNNLQLTPKLITKYIRFSFQDEDSDFIRISLDSNLRMINKSGSNILWHDSSEFLDSSKIHFFPYNVLEIKLREPFIDDRPEWLDNLLNSNDIIKVPKFSKYCHGISIIKSYQTKIEPYWINENKDDFINKENNEIINSITRINEANKDKQISSLINLDPRMILSLERNLYSIFRLVIVLYRLVKVNESNKPLLFVNKLLYVFVLFFGVISYFYRIRSLENGNASNFNLTKYNFIMSILFIILILIDILAGYLDKLEYIIYL
jgi:SPX domain protein involved in polyphosphate accumulation